MKFIHIADIHASKQRLPQTLHILKTLTERAKQGDIDFILFAGDFYDSTMTVTKASGFSDILKAKRELEEYVTLYFISGTPSHEPNGCLDAFKSDKTYVFDSNQTVIIPRITDDVSDPYLYDKTCLICIPEPRRSNFISKSSKETDRLINYSIKEFIDIQKEHNVGKYKETIVMYHGEVKGAVYQNGISASCTTAISKELLQSLKADYYALGHIHIPQEVFHNAWYSGSACPKDFGETHDGCYNLVEIKDGKTSVERVSFGLPIYATYNVDYPFEIPHGDWSNYNIRFKFDITKEQKKVLDIKYLAKTIKDKTNAISVKLEPNIIEGENVFVSEVTKHKSIVWKMIEYAKEKNIAIPKYAKGLLQDIEDNTLTKLAYPQHSFELLSLSLRGSIGIRDGQHKDDFNLNFEQYEDGVVCLIGNCGTGKSSILENCHPYPCMLTREGTLKDHFYLKDSHRILIYKDENGLYYKISMLIDGKTASGKVSYFVETSKNREQWNSVPEVDGSLETYKQWVESTFGGKDIFLRTAFFAKEPVKDTTDISETTKSERMELLSKLAGTEHLKAVSKIAHELRVGNKQKKIIGIEDTIETIENEIKSFSHYEDTIEENEKNINSWNDELKQQEQYISDLEDKVSKLKEKDREYQKVKAVAETNAELYSRYNSEYNTLSENINVLEDAVANQNIFNDVTEANSFINENIPTIEDKNKELESKKAVGDELAKTLLNLTRKKNEIDLSIKEINISINSCKEKITDVTDVCPTCGARLSEEKKKELNKIVSEAEDELKGLEYKEYELQLDLGKALFDINEKEAEKSVIDNEIDILKKSIDYLSCRCNEYTEFLDSLSDVYKTHTYDETLNKLEQSKVSIKELQSKMDSIANTSIVEDVSEQLENAEHELKNKQTSLAEIKANINAAKKQNEEYDKELRLVADKKEKLEELKDTAIAYSFIEDTFSNNGIPAIELKESAPEIADIANRILADSYGNKFTVRFGPSSDLKTNRKANEDFNIIVYDSENDDEKTIDNVSSGEKIWIKQALFYAFSIVQMNRTGFNFRVRLIDESDGSLDGGLRPKYLKMVTSAHEQASARLTILITHSQEIKDIAQQIIEI